MSHKVARREISARCCLSFRGVQMDLSRERSRKKVNKLKTEEEKNSIKSRSKKKFVSFVGNKTQILAALKGSSAALRAHTADENLL
jgi:hypothetical protein